MMRKTLAACLAALIVAPAAAAEPIGRRHQLFLDDHLIEHREHLARRVQPAEKYPGSPLIVRAHDWEPTGYVLPSVLYDEQEKIYKAWLDGYGQGVFYFTSPDGIRWERPQLRLFPEFDAVPTNRVVLSGFEIAVAEAPEGKLDYLRSRERGWRYFGHCSGVVKDLHEADPARRYKMFFMWMDRGFKRPGSDKPEKFIAMGAAFSPDGIHWTPLNEPVSLATVDCPFHVHRDDASGRWTMYGRTLGVVPDVKKTAQAAEPNLRHNTGRAVARAESADGIHWTPEKGKLVLACDEQDGPVTEIYDMRAVPYEGLLVGFVHVFHNEPDGVTLPIELAVSRDGGRQWRRLEDRTPFLGHGGVGGWDRSVISPPVSDPIAVGDELRFYYTGRNALHSTRWTFADDPKLLPTMTPFRGSLGLATLKRDRFVALEASYRPGILRTKPFTHDGGTLHVNAAIPFGVLNVRLLGADGHEIQKTSISARDAIAIPLSDLTSFATTKGHPVRLEFSLQNGRLFSYWVAP
jgi:hypothetical protein